MPQREIRIKRVAGEWYAVLTDPDEIRLMGTGLVPLPYRGHLDAGDIAERYMAKGFVPIFV